MSDAIPHPISRRDMLRRTATGMATLALGTGGTDGRPPARPPNIVFILADDLGYADVACYGRPDIRTPSIDHLAAGGVRFLQAYANSAVCSATRVGLITGRYQYRLRLGLEEPLTENGERRAGAEPPDAAVTIKESRLRLDARRQVAPGHAAQVRPAAERLRSFLWLSRRGGGLLLPRRPGREGRLVGRGRSHSAGGLPDGAARQPGRRRGERLRQDPAGRSC